MLTCFHKIRRAAPARFGQSLRAMSDGAGLGKVRMALTISFVVLASPAVAFDANQIARGTWQGFKTACGQAVSDPQGYLNAAPALAPAGTRPVASSPDGRVVTTSILRGRVEERVQFLGFPDRMVVFCHVHSMDAAMQTGLPGGLAEQLMANPDLMNDPNFLAQIEGNLNAVIALDLRSADTAIGAALAQIIAQDPGATLFGGAIPLTAVEDYLAVPFNNGSTVAERNYHSFGIETRFGDVAVHAIAEVQYGGLWIALSHAIEAER